MGRLDPLHGWLLQMDSRWTSPPIGARGRNGLRGAVAGRARSGVLSSDWSLDREAATDLSANCVVSVERKTFHSRYGHVNDCREPGNLEAQDSCILLLVYKVS